VGSSIDLLTLAVSSEVHVFVDDNNMERGDGSENPTSVLLEYSHEKSDVGETRGDGHGKKLPAHPGSSWY
jgi:hypothetical protein